MNEVLTDKCTNTYAERIQGRVNIAEERFEKYCRDKDLSCQRMGFDTINGYIPDFYNMHPMIRGLPDYVVTSKGKSLFAHVKGTNKFKLEDLINYSAFEELFCQKIGLYVAFCFENKTIIRTLNQIKEMIVGTVVKKFENDGNIYFDLQLERVTK